MQGGQLGKRTQLGDDGVVQDRGARSITAVYDAVNHDTGCAAILGERVLEDWPAGIRGSRR